MDTKYNNKIVQGQCPSFLKVTTQLQSEEWKSVTCHLQINSCNDFAQMKKCYQRKNDLKKTKPIDKQTTHMAFACTNIEIWLNITVKITIPNIFCHSNQWSVSFNALIRHVISLIIAYDQMISTLNEWFSVSAIRYVWLKAWIIMWDIKKLCQKFIAFLKALALVVSMIYTNIHWIGFSAQLTALASCQ